jgi:hypothetical protein
MYKDKVDSHGLKYLREKLIEEAEELISACKKEDLSRVIDEWLDVVGLVEAVAMCPKTEPGELQHLRNTIRATAHLHALRQTNRKREPIMLTYQYLAVLSEGQLFPDAFLDGLHKMSGSINQTVCVRVTDDNIETRVCQHRPVPAAVEAGCFHCSAVFPPSLIEIGRGRPPVLYCPYCGIDSILFSCVATTSREFQDILRQMKYKYFG